MTNQRETRGRIVTRAHSLNGAPFYSATLYLDTVREPDGEKHTDHPDPRLWFNLGTWEAYTPEQAVAILRRAYDGGADKVPVVDVTELP